MPGPPFQLRPAGGGTTVNNADSFTEREIRKTLGRDPKRLRK
jgi:hypothetical protein